MNTIGNKLPQEGYKNVLQKVTLKKHNKKYFKKHGKLQQHFLL